MHRTRRLKLVIAYDGSDFVGWQIQPNGPTIQNALAEAIETITGVRSIPVGSGRTDSGVHALAQVAHVDVRSNLPARQFKRALNHHLPREIVVHDVADVPMSFHSQKSAVRKRYRYLISDGEDRDVFLRGYAWRVRYRLNEAAMARAAQDLVGTHDFRSFETDWPNRASSVRTMYRCDVSRLGETVIIDAEANGFLYNMVRTIAGTLVEVGRGRRPVTGVKSALDMLDRAHAGPTAPPEGLYLVRVDYADVDSCSSVGENSAADVATEPPLPAD